MSSPAGKLLQIARESHGCFTPLTFLIRASGLGRACVVDICKRGGNAVILDMNQEQGDALAQEFGSSAKFWTCDVTDTENIAQVVQKTADWVKETKRPLGGIIPAAGVGLPALVRRGFFMPYYFLLLSACPPGCVAGLADHLTDCSRSSIGKASQLPWNLSTLF